MDSVHKCLYSRGMTLGENIKVLRDLKDVTFEAIGLAVGTDGQNIFNLVKRKSKKSEFAPKLATYFGVDLVDLMSKDLAALSKSELEAFIKGKPKLQLAPEIQSEERPVTLDEAMELLALFEQADRRGRTFIMDTAKATAKRNKMRWAKVADDER